VLLYSVRRPLLVDSLKVIVFRAPCSLSSAIFPPPPPPPLDDPHDSFLHLLRHSDKRLGLHPPMYSVQGLEILYDLMILQYMYQIKEKENPAYHHSGEHPSQELDIHIRLFSRNDQDRVECIGYRSTEGEGGGNPCLLVPADQKGPDVYASILPMLLSS
jgi:hypothetical protein